MKYIPKKNPKLRVLIIEDSDDDATIILLHLEREGYDVEHLRIESAESMRKALSQDSWNVIICDHALPSFDSFAALKIARDFDEDLPFIVVSGKIGEETAVEAMRAGADDYIMKDRLKRLGPVIDREMLHAEDRRRKRQAGEERVELEEQLRQSQKMEAIGQLAGGIAHDFNNLLTVINSYGTVLLKEIGPDNPWHSDVREILDASHRAAILIRQLLAFSRKQILHPKVIDLGRVVEEMQNVLGRLIGERIELVVRIAPGVDSIKADPIQIEQVVMNLVLNARDAISQGGCVTLSVDNVKLDDRTAAAIGDLTSGDYIILAVSDDGAGMDEETRSHIFEPFYTTKGIGKGTGLGLSTVFGIVTQSGGGIEVDSETGKGSDFRVYFPSVDAATQSAEQQIAYTGPLEGNETILVVEDEEAILNLLVSTLDKFGYTVLFARHGEDALVVVEEHGRRIDALITDVIMPQMGGYELAERLAPMQPEMSVLFMSGYSEESEPDQAKQKPQNLIRKPFVAQEVVEKIRTILDTPPSD